MDIVLCTDNNLVKQTCVLITSVLLTNADEKIHFHILTLGTTEDDKIKLEKSVRNIAEITLYTILEKDFNQFPIHSSYITRGTYLRFFIEEALPKTIKKALYLDIDIIVCKSLKIYMKSTYKTIRVQLPLMLNVMTFPDTTDFATIWQIYTLMQE